MSFLWPAVGFVGLGNVWQHSPWSQAWSQACSRLLVWIPFSADGSESGFLLPNYCVAFSWICLSPMGKLWVRVLLARLDRHSLGDSVGEHCWWFFVGVFQFLPPPSYWCWKFHGLRSLRRFFPLECWCLPNQNCPSRGFLGSWNMNRSYLVYEPGAYFHLCWNS